MEESQSDMQPPATMEENVHTAEKVDIKIDSAAQKDTKSPSKNNRPRSNTCPTLHSPTHARKLKMGSRVVILGTENVEQRVPQYVGVEATVVDVPGMMRMFNVFDYLLISYIVHPATWFKVQFEDGAIVTFRPSALRLAADCVNMESADFHIAHNRPKNADGESRVPRPKVANRPRSNSSSSAPEGTNLLSATDPDSWPTCRVRVLSGRYTGLEAIVRSSGNGWVQLDTTYGEVAKRANELELLEAGPGGSFSSTLEGYSGLPASVPRANFARRRSNSESVVSSPTARNTLFNTSSLGSRKTAGFSAPENADRLVLVDAKTRAMQQEYMERFIQKQQLKYRNRPDLKYWVHQIKGGMVDSLFERDMSRDLRDNFCPTCTMEKWPASKFCWSELCPSSPVYWRLPGAAGNPQTPSERYEAIQNLLCSQREIDKSKARERSRTFSGRSSTLGNSEGYTRVRSASGGITGHMLSSSSGITEVEEEQVDSDNEEGGDSFASSAKRPRLEANISSTCASGKKALNDPYIPTKEEEFACSVLGSLNRQPPAHFKHTDALVNIVTEFINGVPTIQLGASHRLTGSGKDKTQNADSKESTPVPVPVRSLGNEKPPLVPTHFTTGTSSSSSKNVRSDSSHTDSEDLLTSEKTNTSPRQLSVNTHIASSPVKRLRTNQSPFSPGGRFQIAAPPSQEEFALLVSQQRSVLGMSSSSPNTSASATTKTLPSQHISTKAVSVRSSHSASNSGHLTIPISVLAARASAAKLGVGGHSMLPPGEVSGSNSGLLPSLSDMSQKSAIEKAANQLSNKDPSEGSSSNLFLSTGATQSGQSDFLH